MGGNGADRMEGDLPFVEDLGDESFVVWGEADDAEGAFFEVDVFDGIEGFGFFQAVGEPRGGFDLEKLDECLSNKGVMLAGYLEF